MLERKKDKGIHHVCLRVPDLNSAAEFYKNAFDAEIVCEWGRDENNDHAFIMDLGCGDFLEIFGDSRDKWEMGNWQHVAVWSDDIYASVERAVSAGAELISPPRVSHIPTREGFMVHMKFSFLKAPGGEIVEIIQEADEND